MAKKLTIKDFLLPSGQPKSNIADLIDKDELASLGLKVAQETERDLATMSDWIELTNKAMSIAKQVLEVKNTPWQNAANVKYPLITGASIQFAARAYAEVIKGNDVVKGKVVGADPDGQKAAKSKRKSTHMSYQLLEEMPEWEPQTDQMLHMMPVIGTCFKKSYFCPLRGRNVSELVKAGEGGLIFDNKNTKDLETTRRVTHEFPLYGNDIKERISAKLYIEEDMAKLMPADSDGDEQAPHTMLEQHRWMDLDKDGYEEPYIVTIHKPSSLVLRVVPRYDHNTVMVDEDEKIIRITPATYFTKYGFFPDPEGGFLDLGFGHILYPINETINSTINQLLDAGTLANRQGGFVSRGFRAKANTFSLGLGEWKQLDIASGDMKNSLMPLPMKGPSPVLFQLLGFMVEAGKSLANQTEVLQGQTQANTPATTTLALIEQGLKVYNAIYKRFYRSLKAELNKLAKLNKIYLEDVVYFNILDEEGVVARADYDDANADVIPVADPSASTEVQRMARAQALMQILQHPSTDDDYILAQYAESIGEDPKKVILAPEKRQQPTPDPKLIELQEKMSYNGAKIKIEEALAISQIEVNNSIVIANTAKAEAAEVGQQLQQYMAIADANHKATMQMFEQMKLKQEGAEVPEGAQNGQQGAVSGMEAELGNAGIPDVPEGLPPVTGRVIDTEGDGRLDGAGDGL